jgi:hypothetical protein
MEKSSQIAWKIVPLGHFFPLKVVPLIEVLLYKRLHCNVIGGTTATVNGTRPVNTDTLHGPKKHKSSSFIPLKCTWPGYRFNALSL